MNMLTQISGGTSSQLVSQNLAEAVADPGVHSIILAIDSPGGTVDGTQLLADQVHSVRNSKKQIVSLASGSMCSAAYWIGSAAQAVFIVDSTTAVGSIGVVTTHTDTSGAQAAQGLKTTEISAGKYKRIASQYGPLSADGRKTIQDQLDYTYSLFVDAVAKHRGIGASQVLARMADGRVFIGQQAIDVGLVDGVRTMDALIAELNSSRATGGAFSIRTTLKPTSKAMSLQEVSDKAKAIVKKNPGMNFIAAVKSIEGDHRYSAIRR
jgi:signal peptide peptidase SppA